jgi:hypothetical protein
MIADLAALHPDDAAAVLSALEPDARAKTEALLREYAAYVDGSPAVDAGAYDPTRLSPWLVQRADSAADSDFEMTPHAHRALRASVMRLYPLPQAAVTVTMRPGLFGRMATGLRRAP